MQSSTSEISFRVLFVSWPICLSALLDETEALRQVYLVVDRIYTRKCDVFDQFVAGREYKMVNELLVQVDWRCILVVLTLAYCELKIRLLFCWISIKNSIVRVLLYFVVLEWRIVRG